MNKAKLLIGATMLTALTGLCADTLSEAPAVKASKWIVLIPVLVPMLIAVVKGLVPNVPVWLLPILAPILGAGADILLHFSTGGQSDPSVGAALGMAGVGVREIVDQLNKRRKLPVALLAIGLSIGLIAPGCGSLEPGGAYAPVDTNGVATAQPDKVFYTVDASFELAYKSLDFIFAFEASNRNLLWRISPEIKRGLDVVRPKAVQLRDEYILARIVYKANPVPANLDALKAALEKIEQLLATAQAVMQTKEQAFIQTFRSESVPLVYIYRPGDEITQTTFCIAAKP
jgi:hypothetical protein